MFILLLTIAFGVLLGNLLSALVIWRAVKWRERNG